MSHKRITPVTVQKAPNTAPVTVGAVDDANGDILVVTPEPIVTPEPVAPVTPEPIAITGTNKLIQQKHVELLKALTTYQARIDSITPDMITAHVATQTAKLQADIARLQADKKAHFDDDDVNVLAGIVQAILSVKAEMSRLSESAKQALMDVAYADTVLPTLNVTGKSGKKSGTTTHTRETLDLSASAAKVTAQGVTRFYHSNPDGTLTMYDSDAKGELFTLSAEQVKTLKLTSKTALAKLHGNLLCPASELHNFTFDPNMGSIGSRVAHAVTRFTVLRNGWDKVNCNGSADVELVAWPLVTVGPISE